MKANLKSRQFSEPAVTEEKHECNECKDKGIIVYRIHKSTEERMKNEGKRFDLAAHEMVREEDFLAGKVCSPQEAKEWKTTFSRQCPCVAERAARKKQMKLMSASNISEGFRKLTFKKFTLENKPDEIKELYNCAFEYAQKFKEIRDTRENSIALLGQSGSGKTHLLTSISNGFIERYKLSVMYFPYLEGMTDLREDFNSLAAKLKLLKTADVLFIDDLFKPMDGVPQVTPWQFTQIQEIVNYRYLNYKPIMVSCELDLNQLLKIDEAFAARIYEMVRDYTVTIERNIKLNHRLEGAF